MKALEQPDAHFRSQTIILRQYRDDNRLILTDIPEIMALLEILPANICLSYVVPNT